MDDTVGLWPFINDEGQWRWCVVGGFYIGDYWVEDGFETDLASIPWYAQFLFQTSSPDTAVSAAGHDWLLKLKVDEQIAAALFLKDMKERKVEKWKRTLFFYAVLFGSQGW
jgi:hypothetical protein